MQYWQLNTVKYHVVNYQITTDCQNYGETTAVKQCETHILDPVKHQPIDNVDWVLILQHVEDTV